MRGFCKDDKFAACRSSQTYQDRLEIWHIYQDLPIQHIQLRLAFRIQEGLLVDSALNFQQ